MFDFIFDPETNGIVLQEAERPLRREVRPVYAEEMDLLGFGRVFDYPRDTGLLRYVPRL